MAAGQPWRNTGATLPPELARGPACWRRALIERIFNSADNERNPATCARHGKPSAGASKKTKSVKVASLPYRQLPALYAELTAVGEGSGLTVARVLRFLILTSVRLVGALALTSVRNIWRSGKLADAWGAFVSTPRTDVPLVPDLLTQKKSKAVRIA